jgi:ribosomal protein L11 methyltransferase
LIRLAVRCTPEQADLVLAELTVLAPSGVEERNGPGYVEFAIYGGEGELPELGELEVTVGDSLVEVVATEVADDWADRWQEFHKPVMVGERIWLRPSWEEPRPDALEVVVDPGRAFGTGAHPTTRLCLELLLELAEAGEAKGPLTDLGTGSGVLAIAAAKLGWEPVRGCDHDPTALQVAASNAAANDVSIELEQANVREGLPALAETTIANLTAPLLRAVGDRLEVASAPGVLVCSGLLRSDLDEVASAFAPAGLGESQRRRDGDWAALLLRRA